MSLHRYREALGDCQQAVALPASDPNVKTLTRMARCHFQLGDLDSARSAISRAKQIDAKDSALESLSNQVQRTSKYLEDFKKDREAKSYGMASIALDKASAEVHNLPLQWRLMRADLMLQRNQLENANSVVSDALRLHPNDPEALVVRAKVLLAMGSDLGKAIQHAQAALRADPEHKLAIQLLRKCRKLETAKEQANTAFKAGKTEEAVDLYTQALDLAKDDQDQSSAKGYRAVLFTNRATANAKLTNHSAAIEDCTQSISINEDNAKAYRIRARSYLATEKYEEAVFDFKKAVEQSSTSESESLKRELHSAEIDLKRSKKKE